MVSVIATNRKWGEVADETGTRVGICLINRWNDRINEDGISSARANAPKRGEGGGEGLNNGIQIERGIVRT